MDSRVPLNEHAAMPWHAHQLLGDFTVEDVWRFPVVLSPEHDLAVFRGQMMAGMTAMSRFHPAQLLLSLRLAIGRVLGWDRVGRGQGRRVRDRYTALDDRSGGIPAASGIGFTEVYDLDDEYLSEIENRTVHAALHLGRVPTGPATFAVHLAVYVRPKGRFGRLYMGFIRPFRRWIVYPAILRAAARRWAAYRAGESD